MTRHHLEALRAEFPEVSKRLCLMSQLVGQVYDIEDPFDGTPEDDRRCAAEIDQLLNYGFTRLIELTDRMTGN